MRASQSVTDARVTPSGKFSFFYCKSLYLLICLIGIPAVTYVRVLNPEGGVASSDIISDGSSVTILEPNKPSSRHESASFVLPRGISDQETCENTIGPDAGGSNGTGGMFKCEFDVIY